MLRIGKKLSEKISTNLMAKVLKMKNLWLKTKKQVAEMRLGGMAPASYSVELPVGFKFMNKIIFDALGHATIFCQPDQAAENADIIWIDKNHVDLSEAMSKRLGLVCGKKIELVYSPSYRFKWITFTVKKKHF